MDEATDGKASEGGGGMSVPTKEMWKEGRRRAENARRVEFPLIIRC